MTRYQADQHLRQVSGVVAVNAQVVAVVKVIAFVVLEETEVASEAGGLQTAHSRSQTSNGSVASGNSAVEGYLC